MCIDQNVDDNNTLYTSSQYKINKSKEAEILEITIYKKLS